MLNVSSASAVNSTYLANVSANTACHETTARAARLERRIRVTLVRLASNVRVSQGFPRDSLEGFATLLQKKGQMGSALDEAWCGDSGD